MTVVLPTRERLLRSAQELIEEGGYGAASVAQVAERAGVAAGTLYRHFASKEDLFVEVFRAVCSGEERAMRTASAELASAGAVAARLRSLLAPAGVEMSASRDDDGTGQFKRLIPVRHRARLRDTRIARTSVLAQRTTQYTGIGWLFPFSSIGGHAVRRGVAWRACRISSVMRIWPASAAEQSR